MLGTTLGSRYLRGCVVLLPADLVLLVLDNLLLDLLGRANGGGRGRGEKGIDSAGTSLSLASGSAAVGVEVWLLGRVGMVVVDRQIGKLRREQGNGAVKVQGRLGESEGGTG